MNKPDFLKPVLLAGTIAGLLSGIPCINFLNCFCCAWVILGGGLAAHLYVQSCETYYPTDGDGALAGLGAGVLAGLIAGVLNGLSQFLAGPVNYEQFFMQMHDVPPEMQEFMEQMMEFMTHAGPLFLIAGIFMNMIIFGGFAALGGFLGMRFSRPRRFPPHPPWPPRSPYGQGPGSPWPGPGGTPAPPGYPPEGFTPGGPPPESQGGQIPPAGPAGPGGGEPPPWGSG